MRRCVEGACEDVDCGWDVELVGEEEQEVRRDILFGFGFRLVTFMIFTIAF